VPDFLSRSKDERTSYIEKLIMATMAELHAAEGPQSFGWIASNECEQNECNTDMLDCKISSLDLLNEDPRLESISSSVHEAMVEKAQLLLDNKSVWRGPPTADGNPSFSVASVSQGRPNYVVMDNNTGKLECECANWKSLKICSPALAVAEREDTLHGYLDFYGNIA